MIFYQKGSETTSLSLSDIKSALKSTFDKMGIRKKVLVIPPDYTRHHSQAGLITSLLYEHFGESLTDILPALGTHAPMTKAEIEDMFKGIPSHLFRVHDWRKDVVTVGSVPGDFVAQVTDNAIDYAWPVQLNRLIWEGKHDLIISVGQVVPHEVIGMANYNKNLFVGTGGSEGINKSHFVGAVYGMERLMGRADNPVRRILNYASDKFINHLPVLYIHTVIGTDAEGNQVIRGLYIGDDAEVFLLASELSLKVNFILLDEPLKKVVVYLDPSEFKSAWLGNKSIYRTRMALADKGELIILAPGLKEFGEDKEIDRLIRKYGYKGTKSTLESVKDNDDLKNNLSAAAHLIHGSSEGRFSITYCPGNLTREEIESVNYKYASPDEMLTIYDISKLRNGYNELQGGEIIYYISNPALGLWAHRSRFN